MKNPMKIDLSHFEDPNVFEQLAEDDFVGLAGFRLALRKFLTFSEAAVRAAGVTTQQYQAMLAVRARRAQEISIKELAAELMLKPNGAVQLIDRLEAIGMVQRRNAENDRRSVLVSLTQLGDRVIEVLGAEHLSALVEQRPLLVESLRRLKAMAD
jgi:DNA-binding MarR family transcriptional regulator